MKKLLFVIFGGLILLFPSVTFAQEEQIATQESFYQAKVVSIEEDKSNSVGGFEQPFQKVKLQLISGPENGKQIEVEHGGLFSISEEQKVRVGETVVVTKTAAPGGEIYYITDKYRLMPLLAIFALFLAAVLVFGKRKGLMSIAGLLISILVLIKLVVPQILAGTDPLKASLGGALIIAVISLYMAHGISRRTTVALASTIITLLIAAALSIIFVGFANIGGTGSEEAIFLRMGPLGSVDLKGILLGGIIIGTLGVLDDITTSQSAAVDEIKKANSKLSKRQLFERGLSVGREHIASLVNTLALAYAGASFPLLLLFSISPDIPLWLTLNSEFIAEEVVRTLVGSIALVLAVPISTFLAANFLSKSPKPSPARRSSKT